MYYLLEIDWFQYQDLIKETILAPDGSTTYADKSVWVQDFLSIAMYSQDKREYFAINSEVNRFKAEQQPAVKTRLQSLPTNPTYYKTKQQIARDIPVFLNPNKPVQLDLAAHVNLHSIASDGYSRPVFYGINQPYHLVQQLLYPSGHPSLPAFVYNIPQMEADAKIIPTDSGYPQKKFYTCITSIDNAKYAYDLLQYIWNRCQVQK